MPSPAPQLTRLPFRRLRGPVPVWYLEHLSIPRLHLTPECPTLRDSRNPGTARHEVRPDVWSLAEDPSSRPCRMCALASVVITVCLADEESTLPFTVASQASPYRVDGDPARTDFRTASATGAQRLVRLARRLGWTLAHTPFGPVASGTASPRAVAVLSANLRTATLPPGTCLDAAALEMLWVLVCDAPPELGGELDFASAATIAARI